jgi:hypothetical protein
MDQMTPSPARRKRGRTLAIAAFIVLLPIAAHAVWDQVEASRMQRFVDELRASGEPVDLREQERPIADDEARQASRLYYAAAMVAADAFMAPGSVVNPVLNFRTKLAESEQALAQSTQSLPSDDPRLAELSRIVDRSDAAFMLLDKAAFLRFDRFSAERSEYSYLDNDLMQLAAVNAVRTDLRSFAGDGDGAARALLAGVRLLRASGQYGRGVSGAAFGSLRLMLARTAPSDRSLEALQRAYAELSADDGLARDLQLRRARIIGGVWPTMGRPFFAQRIGSNRTRWQDWPPGSLSFTILRPWITHEFLRGMREMDAEIATMRKPWPEKLGTGRPVALVGSSGTSAAQMSTRLSLTQRLMARTNIPIWMPAFAGAMQPTVVRAGRMLAQSRVAVTVLATERWRRSHGGAVPADLNVLVPDFLPDVPQDPFTGRALRLSKAADGYTIYSVGIDRVDNGGDVGAWSPDVRGSNLRNVVRDIGIRVRLK